MQEGTPKRPDKRSKKKIALLWDESFLWGLVAYGFFSKASQNFDIVSAGEVSNGALDEFDMLFVPGGWASNKSAALGEAGRESIRSFVKAGGAYLGFCGGAGLALSHKDGLGLVALSRKPTAERLPSFSGKIELVQDSAAHPIWTNIPDRSSFSAWWPGQFAEIDDPSIRVIATYGRPEVGSTVADLPVDPLIDWGAWEKIYGTNLNPERLKGQPAIVEASYGQGKMLLSYLHFETPGDDLGHKVFLNMLDYLTGADTGDTGDLAGVPDTVSDWSFTPGRSTDMPGYFKDAVELELLACDLISFGEKNFLWYWRAPWMIQWRRGVRGVEYLTLYVMLAYFTKLIKSAHNGGKFDKLSGVLSRENLGSELAGLRDFCVPFFARAKQLLLLERLEMNKGPITPLYSDNKEVQHIRQELFSNAKSFGGYYKQIIDRLDKLIFAFLKADRGR